MKILFRIVCTVIEAGDRSVIPDHCRTGLCIAETIRHHIAVPIPAPAVLGEFDKLFRFKQILYSRVIIGYADHTDKIDISESVPSPAAV